MPKVSEIFGIDGYSNQPVPLFGIECEIEALTQIGDLSGVWGVTEDGSLRNGGREFISIPLTKEQAINAFKELHSKIKYNMRGDPFSERTSIHVHVNTQPLTDIETKNVLFLYALFEEYFFSFVHSSRRGNIHCVPLTETYLSSYYNHQLRHLHQRWSKYTAFNLVPLSQHGTIEFRHMHGHNDPVLFAQWLTLIENLYSTAKIEKDLISKNLTFERVTFFFEKLFSFHPQYLLWKNQLPEKTFNTSLDLKLSL